MSRQPLTEAEENHLRYLQDKHRRLDSDYSWELLDKFVRSLERRRNVTAA